MIPRQHSQCRSTGKGVRICGIRCEQCALSLQSLMIRAEHESLEHCSDLQSTSNLLLLRFLSPSASQFPGSGQDRVSFGSSLRGYGWGTEFILYHFTELSGAREGNLYAEERALVWGSVAAVRLQDPGEPFGTSVTLFCTLMLLMFLLVWFIFLSHGPRKLFLLQSVIFAFFVSSCLLHPAVAERGEVKAGEQERSMVQILGGGL